MRLPSLWARLAIAAVALLLLLAAPISAQDVIANDDNTEASLFWLRTNTWQAQPFTPFYDATVTAVTFEFADNPGGSGKPTNFQVFVYDDGSSAPGTEQAEFDCSSFDISTASTTPVAVTCTLDPGYAVNAADTHWIVFTSTDSDTNRGEISFSNGASAPDNAGSRGTLGFTLLSSDSGSTWGSPPVGGTEPRLRLSIAVDIETHHSIANDDAAHDSPAVLSSTSSWAQPFIASTPGSVLAVTFAYHSSGSSTSATVDLYDSDSGEPGTSLGTFTCPASFESGDDTTTVPVTCGLGPSVTVATGQIYWIVWSSSDSNHGRLSQTADNSENSDALGSFAAAHRHTGSGWTEPASNRIRLDISFALAPVVLPAPTAVTPASTWANPGGFTVTTAYSSPIAAESYAAYGQETFGWRTGFGAGISNFWVADTQGFFAAEVDARSIFVQFVTGDDVTSFSRVFSGPYFGVEVRDDAVVVLLNLDDNVLHAKSIPALPNTRYTIGIVHTGTQVVFYDGLSAFYAVASTAKPLPSPSYLKLGMFGDSGLILGVAIDNSILDPAQMRAYLPIDICERGGVDPVMVVHVSPMVGTETTETMTAVCICDDCADPDMEVLTLDSVDGPVNSATNHGGQAIDIVGEVDAFGTQTCWEIITRDVSGGTLDQINNMVFPAKSIFVQVVTGTDIDTFQVIYEQGAGSNNIVFYIEGGQIIFSIRRDAGTPQIAFFAIPAESNTLYTLGVVIDGAAGTIKFYNGLEVVGEVATDTTGMPGHIGNGAFGCMSTELSTPHLVVVSGEFSTNNYPFDGLFLGHVQVNSVPDVYDMIDRLPVRPPRLVKLTPASAAAGSGDTAVAFSIAHRNALETVELIVAGQGCGTGADLAYTPTDNEGGDSQQIFPDITIPEAMLCSPTVFAVCLNGVQQDVLFAVTPSPAPVVWFHHESTEVSTDGDFVAWRDISGNGNDATISTAYDADDNEDSSVRPQLMSHDRHHAGDLMMTIVALAASGDYEYHGNFIELFCRNDVYDLSTYDLWLEFKSDSIGFDADSCNAGEFIYVSFNPNGAFEDFFGFVPDHLIETEDVDLGYGDTDDFVQLRYRSSLDPIVIDQVNYQEGGSNLFPEGFAARVSGSHPSAVVDHRQWTYVSTDDDFSTNAEEEVPYPIGSFQPYGTGQTGLDGVDRSLLTLTNLDLGGVSGTAFSVAFQLGVGLSGPVLEIEFGTGDILTLFADQISVSLFATFNGDTEFGFVTGLEVGSRHVLSGIIGIDEPEFGVYLDSADEPFFTFPSGATGSTTATIRVGNKEDGDVFQGALFEVMVFDGAVDTASWLADIGPYMASKYVTEPVVSSLSGDVVAPSGAIVLSEGESDALPLVYYGTVAAPNTDANLDDFQFAVASDPACGADDIFFATVTSPEAELEGPLVIPITAPRARPSPYFLCMRADAGPWAPTGTRVLVGRAPSTGNAGVVHNLGETGSGSGSGSGGDACNIGTQAPTLMPVPYDATLPADGLADDDE